MSFDWLLCFCLSVFMFSVNNCGTAPYVAHATSTGSTTFGSTVNYTCETGYSGGGSLTCPDSGTWPPTSFNCTGMSSLCRVVQPVLVFFSRFLFVLLLLLLLLCVCVCVVDCFDSSCAWVGSCFSLARLLVGARLLAV